MDFIISAKLQPSLDPSGYEGHQRSTSTLDNLRLPIKDAYVYASWGFVRQTPLQPDNQEQGFTVHVSF